MLNSNLIFNFLLLLVFSLLSVPFITLLERNILGLIGFRVGPNKVSVLGIMQPFSDALKLGNKSINSLSNFSMIFYYLSCVFMLFSSFFLWISVFFSPPLFCLKFCLLIFLLILSFNTLNVILCGWSTFSKFSLAGSMRTVSQLISYEAVLFFCFFFLFFLLDSYNLFHEEFYPISFFFLFFPLCFYCWVPALLGDLNRTPFDFAESESELVSGFNTEFGSSGFTLIFLSEYSSIIVFSLLTSLIFFFNFFYIFFLLFFIFVIWIRSVLPRFRFDKLMYLSWKFLIPFLTFLFIFLVGTLI